MNLVRSSCVLFLHKLQELELLDESSKVYKLIGPVLVLQDLVEATSTVKKRLDFISTEINRVDAKISSLEEKSGKKQAAITKIQSDLAKLKEKGQQGTE